MDSGPAVCLLTKGDVHGSRDAVLRPVAGGRRWSWNCSESLGQRVQLGSMEIGARKSIAIAFGNHSTVSNRLQLLGLEISTRLFFCRTHKHVTQVRITTKSSKSDRFCRVYTRCSTPQGSLPSLRSQLENQRVEHTLVRPFNPLKTAVHPWKKPLSSSVLLVVSTVLLGLGTTIHYEAFTCNFESPSRGRLYLRVTKSMGG